MRRPRLEAGPPSERLRRALPRPPREASAERGDSPLYPSRGLQRRLRDVRQRLGDLHMAVLLHDLKDRAAEIDRIQPLAAKQQEDYKYYDDCFPKTHNE